MNKSEFIKWIKSLFADMRTGYYGQIEFIDEIWDNFEKIKKAFGGCEKCYGKGYSTYRYGIIGIPDFEGDKGFKDPIKTNIVYCTCDRGKQLKELIDVR